MIWNHMVGGTITSCPAVANGQVYIGCDDHNVYALSAVTGAEIWRYGTKDQVSSSPAVANGVIYVGSLDHNIYGLNATNGLTLWSYQTGGACESSPAVSNGVVYIGSDDGYLYAFETLPVNHFVFNFVNAQVAGMAFRVTITAVNAQNNTVINYSGTPALRCTDGSVSPTSLADGFLNGIWSGYLTITTSAVGVTLSVDDGGGHIGTSNPFTVFHATEVSSLVISPSNASVTAGSPKTYSFVAYDQYGNSWDVTSSTSWSISTGADGSWNSNVYNSATAGYWTVSATYGSLTTTTGLTVNSATINHFVVSVSQTVSAGSPFTLTIAAKDAYNNSITGYDASANLSISSGSIYPSNTVSSGWSNGVWNNFVTVSSPASSVAISVSDGSHNGLSNSFVVYAVIVFSAGINGSINPLGNIQITPGASKTFKISADEGYQIDNVLIDGVAQGPISAYTFHSIVANHVISASFKMEPSDSSTLPSSTPKATSGSQGFLGISLDVLAIVTAAAAIVMAAGFQLLRLRVKARKQTRFVPSIDDPVADRAVAEDISNMQEKLAASKPSIQNYPE
jgi:hypothetical protein